MKNSHHSGRRSLVTVDEWVQAARGPAGKNPPVRREAFATVAKDDGGGLSFTISTDDVDRMGDVIDQAGWVLDAYLKNPVMLWAHDYGFPPVAKTGTLKTVKGKLRAGNVVFMDRETFEFGWLIGQMYERGFMHAVSVGFQPLTWAWADQDGETDRGEYAVNYKTQELLEYSAVPVPANANALQDAKSAGLPMSGMLAWLEKTLDMGESAGGLIVPRATLEQMHRSLRGAQVQVPGDDGPDEVDARLDSLTSAVIQLTAAVQMLPLAMEAAVERGVVRGQVALEQRAAKADKIAGAAASALERSVQPLITSGK